MRTRRAKITDLFELKEKFTYTNGFSIKTINSNYLYGDKTVTSGTGILFGIEVLKEFRNKKIATKLITRFEKDLKKDNCGSILMFYNKYDGLDEFYKKVGFEIGTNLVTALKEL